MLITFNYQHNSTDLYIIHYFGDTYQKNQIFALCKIRRENPQIALKSRLYISYAYFNGRKLGPKTVSLE